MYGARSEGCLACAAVTLLVCATGAAAGSIAEADRGCATDPDDAIADSLKVGLLQTGLAHANASGDADAPGSPPRADGAAAGPQEAPAEKEAPVEKAEEPAGASVGESQAAEEQAAAKPARAAPELGNHSRQRKAKVAHGDLLRAVLSLQRLHATAEKKKDEFWPSASDIVDAITDAVSGAGANPIASAVAASLASALQTVGDLLATVEVAIASAVTELLYYVRSAPSVAEKLLSLQLNTTHVLEVAQQDFSTLEVIVVTSIKSISSALSLAGFDDLSSEMESLLDLEEEVKAYEEILTNASYLTASLSDADEALAGAVMSELNATMAMGEAMVEGYSAGLNDKFSVLLASLADAISVNVSVFDDARKEWDAILLHLQNVTGTVSGGVGEAVELVEEAVEAEENATESGADSLRPCLLPTCLMLMLMIRRSS